MAESSTVRAPEAAASVAVARARRLGVLAVLVLVASSLWLVQPFGYNQGAHLALVHALADGTPVVDRYKSFSGDLSYYHGHYYSSKAPGLALVTLPAFVGLRAVGLPAGVHALALLGVVLPALAVMLLVLLLGERLEPRLGTPAAVTVALGTLVLPFSTLFFSHVLSALLGFAAFALLWYERQGQSRLGLVAGAGFLAGFAVTTEYPLAILALVLGVYALARSEPVSHALSYVGGCLLGVAPLLAYNRWAFGSFTHLSYGSSREYPSGGGAPQLVLNAPRGFYGVNVPDPRAAVELLLSSRGLLVGSPVLAAAAAGVVLLFRRGRRAEAVVITAVSLLFLAYNSGYAGAFGGFSPGPRYLVAIVPFLAVPLALAYRSFPLTTLALALVSSATMVLATITEPLLPYSPPVANGDRVDTGRWLDRLRAGEFTDTVAAHAGLGHGWISIAPYLAGVGVGVSLAALATRRLPVSGNDAETAVVAVASWALALYAAPRLLLADYDGDGYLGTFAVILFASAAVTTSVRVARLGPKALLPALPLLALAAPGIEGHRTVALAAALAALAATALAERRALVRPARALPARARS